MSWQEELRRLDSELAAGRIGHAEHRRKREELLAEASGGGDASAMAAPLQPSEQQPPATAAAGTWNAEPVRWNEPTSNTPTPTSFFTPNTPSAPATPPPSSAPNPPYTPTPPSSFTPNTPTTPSAPATPNTPSATPQIPTTPTTDSGTHVWTSANPAAQHLEPPTPEQPGADAKSERPPPGRVARWDPSTGDMSFGTAPSPADVNPTGFLPVTGDTNEPPRQTPELRRLWEEGPPRKKRPTWLFLSVGVLVVLALVVGVIFYLGNRTAPNDRADSVSAPPVPSATGGTDPAASLEDKLPKLDGRPSPDDSTMSLDKAVQLKLVSQADADVMKSSGANELVYRAYADATQKNSGTTLIAVPAPSADQAGRLVSGLRKNLTTGGFTTSPLGPAPTDLIYSASSPAGRVLAYWYTSGPVAIGIGVSEPLTEDAAALKSRLEQIREKVAAALPAG
ncbi:MAG TPA: hypothetical protein VG674_21685 [Amycolatopsis sp.]|nr:hypothetical protein [Amycolatopsis sp.]